METPQKIIVIPRFDYMTIVKERLCNRYPQLEFLEWREWNSFAGTSLHLRIDEAKKLAYELQRIDPSRVRIGVRGVYFTNFEGLL